MASSTRARCCLRRTAETAPAIVGRQGARVDTSQFDRITIGQLRQAGGLKWRAFPDCIGAFVAEMDFGVAAPIRQALHDEIGRASCREGVEISVGSAAARSM